MATTKFSSLDQFSHAQCNLTAPDRYRDLMDENLQSPNIPQGAGLSYVAASFLEGGNTTSLRHFNRILNFDPTSNLLQVEGGTSLGKVFDFLYPLNLYVSVQPGYPQLTFGGLVAANAHGKNQFNEGVFADILESIRLFHPTHGLIEASREVNPDVFALTCGGYGLTGIILDLTLKVSPLPGTKIKMENHRVGSINETLDTLKEGAKNADLMMSWNNLSLLNDQCGSGFVTVGNFTSKDNSLSSKKGNDYKSLDPHNPKKFRPPIFQKWSMPIINAVYSHGQLGRKRCRTIDLFPFLFPATNASFYFDWYGSRGLIEHQVLIPEAGTEDYMKDLLALIRKHKVCVPRASFKLFKGAQKLLHFNGDGFCLSMDFFQTQSSIKLLSEIDQLDIAYNAKANLIKDSRLSKSVFEKQYSEADIFRKQLLDFDPKRIFKSELSQRLGL